MNPFDTLFTRVNETDQFLDKLADTIDAWADESKSGGWSTHQVEANRKAADDCRRQGARLRAAMRSMP